MFVYLDDLLVTSPDYRMHKKHLILFARLAEYGIIIGPDKLSLLGHHVSAAGISPLASAVDAIVNFVRPEKQRALHRYLGMINYYHRFIPNCADKLKPLNQLLTAANEGHTRLSPKSNFDLKWNESANSAFIESKQILANATLLVHPDHTAPLNITCDASDFVIGGVLQQYINNVRQPLSFFSNTERPSLRQSRQLAFIAEFTTDIRYVKGETNLVADALSRLTVSFIDNTSTINYKDLSTDQASDTEFTRLRHSKSSTMNFKLLKSFDNNLI